MSKNRETPQSLMQFHFFFYFYCKFMTEFSIMKMIDTDPQKETCASIILETSETSFIADQN